MILKVESQVIDISRSAAAVAKPRLAYLDMTKGILVLLMVVYHSLNYTNQFYLGFRYLSFLPLSFILITGFLLSSVYSSRYATGDRSLVRRLLVRGVRLLVLFTALNVAAQFVRSPAYGQSVGVGTFFEKWKEVYIIGGSSVATFDVLLPIAYLLLISPGLIAMAHCNRRFLPTVALLLVGACTVLDFNGVAIANLNFVAAGVLGMLVGRVLPNASALSRFFWLTLLAYTIYFPLGLLRGWIFLVQLSGGLAALALICAIGVRFGDRGWWRQRMLRIGQYSLIAYIVQIGILQVLSRFIGRPDPLSVQALGLFLSTLLLMTLFIEAVEWLRKQALVADKAYKAVFA